MYVLMTIHVHVPTHRKADRSGISDKLFHTYNLTNSNAIAYRNPDRQPCMRPALHIKLICYEAFACCWNVNLTKGHTTVGQMHTSWAGFCRFP